MEKNNQNQALIDAVERLPCKLQMCWRSKLLRQFENEDEFKKALGECICG